MELLAESQRKSGLCLCGAAGNKTPAERWLHTDRIYLYSASGLLGLAG